jgi:molecular chaperone GrpE
MTIDPKAAMDDRLDGKAPRPGQGPAALGGESASSPRAGDVAPGTTPPEPTDAPVVEEPEAALRGGAEREGRPSGPEREVAPGTAPPEPTEAPAVEEPPGREEPATPAAQAAPAEAGEPDYRDLYLRALADIDNIRKRARRDVAAAESRALVRLARELLPALDNFDRALAAAEAEEQDEEHHLTKGIRLVQSDMTGALARMGIEPYWPKGESFDPHHHEAVAQQPTEGVAPGTIIEVYQPGYRCGGEMLRPAKVVVAA